ncbi:MAG: hypothetical protein IJA32_15755 [Lachnospiraceae bacterium]|nr:hypothetical protein [Lachnospiraceae bacterium]
MEYKKIKISIFSMISLVFIIILYAIYFIPNTGITLYSDDIRMMIITMVMELTIGQLFNLSIVYLGGTLLISILLNARKKIALTLNIIMIIADIVCIVPLSFAKVLHGLAGTKINSIWTYFISFIWLIVLLIYNICRKE